MSQKIFLAYLWRRLILNRRMVFAVRCDEPSFGGIKIKPECESQEMIELRQIEQGVGQGPGQYGSVRV